MHTDYVAVTEQDFDQHLQGIKGIGLVPIMDDDSACWAAIDIDNHGQDEDIPIAPIDEIINLNKLPLIACRSKSGGVHCYAFFDVPRPAAKVRALMTGWAKTVGYPSAEIFPKQTRLMGKEGKKQLGNWINLPYLGAGETNRYAFKGGRKLNVDEFIDLAEKSKVVEEDASRAVMLDHPQAPPCVQKMMLKGVASGNRNEGLFNAVVYFRKAFPEKIEEEAQKFNVNAFAKPLARAEFQRTVNSAARPDYGYRCNEEPIRSLCDRDACLRRKFGVSMSEAEAQERLSGLPMFSDLTKILADPVRWELKVDATPVRGLSTMQLLDWKYMREAIAERLTRVVPMIKNQEWERMLAPLMGEARVIAAPDDASTAGIIRQRLREFAAKAHDLRDNKNIDDRKALLRGLPIVAVMDGEKSVAFRAQDFVSFLKRTKSEELRGISLWMAVRELGVQHTKMRVGPRNINVWYMPYDEIAEGPDSMEVRSEI